MPTTYDWSGVYFGLNAGVAWNNSELNGGARCVEIDGESYCADFDGEISDAISDAFDNRIDDSSAAFTGGALIGANWQWESFVMGVEADINYAGFDASQRRDLDYLDRAYFDEFNAHNKAEIEMDWWGTLRGRAGFAADNFLFYGTGGLAWVVSRPALISMPIGLTIPWLSTVLTEMYILAICHRILPGAGQSASAGSGPWTLGPSVLSTSTSILVLPT